MKIGLELMRFSSKTTHTAERHWPRTTRWCCAAVGDFYPPSAALELDAPSYHPMKSTSIVWTHLRQAWYAFLAKNSSGYIWIFGVKGFKSFLLFCIAFMNEGFLKLESWPKKNLGDKLTKAIWNTSDRFFQVIDESWQFSNQLQARFWTEKTT